MRDRLRILSRATRPTSLRVGSHVCMFVTLFCIFELFEGKKFRYEYFMGVETPAQIITAPAQPLATGVAVYTAMFFVAEDDPIFI